MTSAFKYPFGREKDKPLNECNKNSLKFYVKNLKLGNPRFDEKNVLMAKECLLYLKTEDIFSILEEIDGSHPAWQMCNDSLNAISNAKKKGVARGAEKPLPVIQLEPKTKTEIIQEVRLFIEDLYKKAAALQHLLDDHTDSGIITRSSEHTPF